MKDLRTGKEVLAITEKVVEETPELFSTQEESDTRMLQHAMRLNSQVKRATVPSVHEDRGSAALCSHNKGGELGHM